MVISPRYQPGLPFEYDAISNNALRAAHARSRLAIPLEAALGNKALSICLRRVAETILKKRCRRRG